ncbi:hypothetical protein [Lacticaseibacillus sp. GG6-2]
MKLRLTALALAALIALGGGYYYNHHQQNDATTATVQSATGAVDHLYRNPTHSLPATDLTSQKIAHAKKSLKQVPTTALDASQRQQIKQAQTELDAAKQMLAVTTATQTPITATKTYQASAQEALTAYQKLQQAKPVFTQVYQQPVSELADAKTAAEAVTDLQTAKEVTPKAIFKTEEAVSKVAAPADSKFPETASSVVDSAKQKLTTPPADQTDADQASSASQATSSSSSSATAPDKTTATSTSSSSATSASSASSTSESSSSK